VELARQVLGSLKGRSALLIGAGGHGKLVATSLLGYGLGELTVANRTFEHAAELARRYGGTACHLNDIERYLDRVDVVVASTGAGRVLVTRTQMARVVRRRRYRSQVLLDLSVPRNIDPHINDLDGVYRFDVDDLREVAAQGVARRQIAAHVAEEIVRDEVEKAWVLMQGEEHRAAMGSIMQRAESIRTAEIERAQKYLSELSPKQQQAVDAMSRAIVKKLLHPAMQQSRAWAEEGDLVRLDAALRALGVEPSDSESS
jgi:glutamyl-tRNA reductase